MSEESKQKLSESLSGKILSSKHKARIGNSLRGVPKPTTTCPYCKKSGGVGAMRRWHFDNCSEI